jgi:hypothetical protein
MRDTRRRRLTEIVRTRFGGVESALAERVGRQPTYIHDLLHSDRKSFGEKIARMLEDELALPRGHLDQPDGVAPLPAAYGGPPVDAGYPSLIAHRAAQLDEAVQLGVLNLLEAFNASMQEARRRGARRVRET